jgi:hypothetical protein
MKQSSIHDAVKIQRALLTVLFILATVWLVYFGFTRNLPMLGLLIPLIALVSWFIGRPAILFCTVLFAENARLLIPGITSTLGISELFQVLMVGWMVLEKAVKHRMNPFSFRPAIDRWVIFFALNMVIIMAVRGSGFAMLGSSTYGGTAYVSIFLSLIFYFAATHVQFSDRQIRLLLWMVLIGAVIPALVQVASAVSPSGFGWLTKFVNAQTEKIIEEQNLEGGVARWSMFSAVSYALIPIAYVLFRKKSFRLILIVLAFFFVAMTGFRSRIFQTAVMVFLTGLWFSKNRMRTFIMWALAGALVLIFLMIAAPMLPRAVQRAVSAIPFIPVDAAIAERAEGSSDWRFDLWRDYCIPNIPRYLLVGRGLAHDITGFAWLQSKWYGGAEFFYFMGRYHSGPLTLLLDLGLVGFVSFTLFFLLVVRDSWAAAKKYASKCDTMISRYYIYLTLLMSYEVFNYYFIFGDIRSSLFRMLMTAAQLRILKKSFLMEDSPKVNVQVVETFSASGRSAFGGKPVNAVNRWARPS